MHFRTRYKLRATPLFFTTVSLLMVATVSLSKSAVRWLETQQPFLPEMVLGVGSLLPAAFFFWYVSSYAEVRRGRLKVRGLRGVQELDLRTIVEAEIYNRGRSLREDNFELLMRLRDSYHDEIWLPLASWRDEDLLVAMVLRAAVDRKVKVGGDPEVVKRFSGLLDTYKTWDRQLAA